MVTKSTIGCRFRWRLRAFPILSLILLSLQACGDKEAPIDPSHLAEIKQA